MIEARIVHRLRGFTLDAQLASKGPVLGVFGRSGSGKTTLLHVIAGLQRAAEASIRLGDAVVAERPGGAWMPPEERGAVLVPQNALLFPHLSVRANLCFAKGAAAELATKRGGRILDVLRLRELLDRRPQTLSGGERQRVSLGRALLACPRLLLLDEPTAALDQELGREVLALLLETKRELGVPMLFVTHKASDLLALADDCVVLEAGSIVANGTPLELLARPRAEGIARLVGVDNILRLDVVRHDEAGGVSLLDLGENQVLAVPLTSVSAGNAVDVGLYAEDVILSREQPGPTSARNALAGSVVALDAVGHEVLVTIRVGSVDLRVRITPGAARELGLQAGAAVFALIKTTACHLLRS